MQTSRNVGKRFIAICRQNAKSISCSVADQGRHSESVETLETVCLRIIRKLRIMRVKASKSKDIST